MRFVGCSLAWRPGEAEDGTSCLVVMDERGSIIANSFAGSAEELAGAVGEHVEERRGVVVGVDAPLSIPNERGTRGVEKVLSRVSLPAYSASRKMFGGEPYAEGFLAALEKVGVEYTDYPLPRAQRQDAVVEVDSAATLKVLYLEAGRQSNGDPAQALRDMGEPRFRKGNKEARSAALRDAVGVLWNRRGLRMRTNSLTPDLGLPENVDISRVEISSSLSHADLDRVAGLIEATLAAYTVYRHWRGRDGSVVVGTGDRGSVLLPASGALRERLFEECRAAGMPFA